MKTICYYLLCSVLLVSSAVAQSWKQGASLPSSGTDGSVEFAIGSKVYFTGVDKEFWEYNTQTDTWTRKADIPGVTSSRGFGVGFSIGSMGYLGMGLDNPNPKNDFWQYDPSTDTWTRKADYPGGKRDGMLYFSVAGKGYVGGGSDNKYIYDQFYSYDPVANTWTKLDALPMGAIAFPSVFIIGAKAYITGGDLGTSNGELSDLYEFDPASNDWKTLAPFSGDPRQTAVGFAINNKGYVGLGQSNYTTLFNDFYSYDPASDQWTKVEGAFPVSPGRAWASAAVVDGKAYIGGGWDFATTFYNDWWKFDPTATAGISTVTVDGKNISVSPNPVSNGFEIHSATSQSFSLYNTLGIKVFSATVIEGKRYDISSLPAGEYLMRFEGSTNGITLVKR